MADIAAVFHWPPQDMRDMSPEELASWREMARERFEAQHAPPQNQR